MPIPTQTANPALIPVVATIYLTPVRDAGGLAHEVDTIPREDGLMSINANLLSLPILVSAS